MALKVAVQMDPIQSINITGDSTFAMMLEAQRRGHALFYYQTKTLALGGGSLFATGNDVTVRDEKGNHFTLGEERRADLGNMRRGADAPGPALRHGLHHRHPHAGDDPPEDAGGERSGGSAQRAGKALRAQLPAVHAGDADHARSRGTRRLPPRPWRHHPEAALRQWRRRRVPAGRGRPEFLIPARTLHADLPRALHRAEIPARRAEGRQAHHPRRRQAGGRHQPRAGGEREPLQHACGRQGRAHRR